MVKMERENKDQTMGYRRKEISTEWDRFRDSVPRHYTDEHNHGVYGVLSDIRPKEAMAYFMPSIVFNLDCSVASINNKEPSLLPLPLKMISPLPEGMGLQDYADEFTARKKEEREAMMMKGKKLIMLPEEFRRGERI